MYLFLLLQEANQSFWCRRMASNGEDDFNNPKRHLNYEQFIEKKDKQNVVVIDVRERSEISETGQIPGSINIPCKHFAYITFFFFF